MRRVLLLTVCIVLLMGCAPAPQTPDPETPPPRPSDTAASPTETAAPLPTATPTDPAPTATRTDPPPTALPEGVLFRDDFDGALQPGWTWINQDPDRWSFMNGWLRIVADDPAFYMEENYGLVNFLTREVPSGEFVITAHVRADPAMNFQQATIYIFEDHENYIALNTGYCSICASQGPGYFMETYIDSNPFEDVYVHSREPNDTNVYLRLVNQAGSVTGYFATAPGEWQRAGAFGNFFEFKSVGLGATNSTTEDIPDLIAEFDYFEIAEP